MLFFPRKWEKYTSNLTSRPFIGTYHTPMKRITVLSGQSFLELETCKIHAFHNYESCLKRERGIIIIIYRH